MDPIIRPEKPEDQQKVRQLNIEAFETEAEANLVDALRNSAIPIISLVAEKDGEITGYILFSPVALAGNKSGITIAGLAPMAVLPGWQKKGVGTLLVKEGLKQCQDAGYDAVVVLGHPDYYPRFGFIPSVKYGITSEYDVPEEVFMAKEINKGALANCRGTVKYHETFKHL